MKERDRESEKAPQPDKAEVICPLIYKLTDLAVNYDLTWQSETKVIVKDDKGLEWERTGVWKSNPVQRGHTNAFQAALTRMREAGEISWDESAYYFTHEEGIEARKAFEQAVLNGELKASIVSWGPNLARADDKSRFHKFTGVSYQELEKKYPELYKKATVKAVIAEQPKEEVKESEAKKAPVTKEAVEEPSKEALEEIQDEERVAAALKVDDIVELDSESEEDGDDTDDHTTLVLWIPMDEEKERIDPSHESIIWKSDDGEDLQAYLVMLPEINTEMWLTPGKWTINGQTYELRVEE